MLWAHHQVYSEYNGTRLFKFAEKILGNYNMDSFPYEQSKVLKPSLCIVFIQL